MAHKRFPLIAVIYGFTCALGLAHAQTPTAPASSGGPLLELPGGFNPPPPPPPQTVPPQLPPSGAPASPSAASPAIHTPPAIPSAGMNMPSAPAQAPTPLNPPAIAAPNVPPPAATPPITPTGSAPYMGTPQPAAQGLTPPAGAIAPVPPGSPPGMPPSPKAAANPEAVKAAQEVTTKNPTILFGPLHLDTDVSLMFRKSDMKVVAEALSVYDKSAHSAAPDDGGNKDDLSSLLDSLKQQNGGTGGDLAAGGGGAAANAPPPPLPNIYLGSIVYYTPSHWSVWLNGKKVTNTTNQPTKEFYVTRLSRTEVEVVWKPATLQDVPAIWQRLTDNGAHEIPNISINEAQGKITMQMHTNQTFIPHSLAIREGLIKSSPVAQTAAAPIGATGLSTSSPNSFNPQQRLR